MIWQVMNQLPLVIIFTRIIDLQKRPMKQPLHACSIDFQIKEHNCQFTATNSTD